jgi:hypothetical protein
MDHYNFVIQLQGGKNYFMDQYIESLENVLMAHKDVEFSLIDDIRTDDRMCSINLTVKDIKSVYADIEPIIHRFVMEPEKITTDIVEFPITIVVAHGKDGWDDYIELYNNSEQLVNTHSHSRKLH